MKNKKQIKMGKLLFIIKNFCYINLSLLFGNLIYSSFFLLSLKFQQGFSFYFLFILQVGYFIFGLYKHIVYQCNTFKLVRLVGDCSLSIIVGKLGTGKTLLLTYLSQVMKLLAENIYSNYPIEDQDVKVLTFNNLDFKDRKKLVPPDDSLILFDESFLYLDGTSPDKEKQKHAGKNPGIVLARQFKNRGIFTAQREGMLGNNIRNLANGIFGSKKKV